MEVIRDAIYYEQLARQARIMAAGHADPDVARHLREAAIKHERKARQLRRDTIEDHTMSDTIRRSLAFWRK